MDKIEERILGREIKKMSSPEDRMEEAKKIVEKFKECAFKYSECTLGLYDPEEEKWFEDMEKVLQQLIFSYYLTPPS